MINQYALFNYSIRNSKVEIYEARDSLCEFL